MPFVCPDCHSEQADERSQCSQCGKPWVSGAAPETEPDSDRRFPFWKILPWTLFAAAVLLLLPHLRPHSTSVVKRATVAAAAPLTAQPAPAAALPPTDVLTSSARPAAAPTPPAKTPAAAKTSAIVRVPLTVTLYSASGGKHVRVGVPVMISALAAVPPGQSATLAVSYDHGSGTKSLLALAQGSFSSTVWTPLAPGHYSFLASALDSRKTSAFSHRLSIWVDAPAPISPLPIYPLPISPIPVSPIHSRIAEVPPAPKVRQPLVALLHPAVRRIAVKPAPVVSVKPTIPAAPLPYHVAAASFPVRRIAATLAGALRRRGFNAIVRPMTQGQPHPTYTVETGDYVRQADAQKQVQLLQRDGYPAYLFRLR